MLSVSFRNLKHLMPDKLSHGFIMVVQVYHVWYKKAKQVTNVIKKIHNFGNLLCFLPCSYENIRLLWSHAQTLIQSHSDTKIRHGTNLG